MPWATPVTKTSGQSLTASNWNTNTSTNVLFVARPPRALVTMSSSQNISSTLASYTTVTVNNLQVGGSGDNPTLVSNQVRPQVAGLYRVTGCMTWPANATGQRLARIALNGATAQFDSRSATTINGGSGSLQPTTQWVEAWITCAINDQITLGAAQDSGSTLSVQANVMLAVELIAVS